MRARTVTVVAMAVAASTLFATAFAHDPVAPALGAPAPKLTFGTWVQGNEVKQFEAGKVYVVEFWATWCGPCKQSIPHLNEMSKKYPDVTFIGVDVWESGMAVKPEDLPKVKSFVTGMGEKMTYDVASDTDQGAMSQNWLQAYEQEGIPAAFIVDKQGRIAFVDHPMDPDFEASLQDIRADKFDIAAAQAKMAKKQEGEAKAMEVQKKLSAALKAASADLSTMIKEGDTQGAEKKLDSINQEATGGDKSLPSINPKLYVLSKLASLNQALYYPYLKGLADGEFASNVSFLAHFAGDIDTNAKLKSPDFALATLLAYRAASLTQFKDPEILQLLSLSYAKNSEWEKASSTETQAAGLVPEPDKTKLTQKAADYAGHKL